MTERETMEALYLARNSFDEAAKLGMGQYDSERLTPEFDKAFEKTHADWIRAIDIAAQWMLAAKGPCKRRAIHRLSDIIRESAMVWGLDVAGSALAMNRPQVTSRLT